MPKEDKGSIPCWATFGYLWDLVYGVYCSLVLFISKTSEDVAYWIKQDIVSLSIYRNTFVNLFL
jgi:hypothetical protein